MSTSFDEFERVSRVLKQIALNYPEGSPEQEALKLAAMSVLFSLTERADEFARYQRQFSAPLTAKQEERLEDLGLKKRRHKPSQK